MSDKEKMSTVKEADASTKTITRIRSLMSLYVLASFVSLFLSAIFFIVAMASTNWYTGADDIRIGVWKYCVKHTNTEEWTCHPCLTDFCVAVQCFSILELFGYACVMLLFVLNLACHSKRTTRLLAIGLCLLAFCIVSLQIMSIIVYGVKVKDYLHQIERDNFSRQKNTSHLSWSFVFAILSVFVTTIAGVFNFIEIRNIVVENFVDT